jgi:hypothetical protein
MEDLQKQMANPFAQQQRVKKSTGKRLTNKERDKLKKQREKLLRKKKRM